VRIRFVPRLRVLQPTLQLTRRDISAAVRRFPPGADSTDSCASRARSTSISVLEEHRIDFPRLIIQSVPKRYYPDGHVGSFVGYTGEISEDELNKPQYAGYKPGQIIGKGGLEKQYESVLHGEEGERYDEVDARGRPCAALVRA
jgi:penicillin-binding protein 2